MTLAMTRRAVVGGLAAALAPTAALAQARPVRIIVPFAPGGGADLIARLIQPHLQAMLGQSFIIENRAGAAGRIGTDAVAKAEPDGQTLLMTTESSIVIAPHMGVSMNYDPLKDFAPVSLLTRNVVVLVVHPSVPAKTLREYIALARAKRGEMFYASSGVGGPNHLAGEIFKQMTGLNIVHVPFQGTGAAIPAVIANQVGAMWGFLAGLIPHIRSGSLRARGRRPGAIAGPARYADGRRGRRAGLRGRVLDRPVGACGNTADVSRPAVDRARLRHGPFGRQGHPAA